MGALSSRILLRPSDLDRSHRFYRDLLGLAISRQFGPPWLRSWIAASGGQGPGGYGPVGTTGSFRWGMQGEAILQASVPELIDRPDGAKDVALASIVQEPQQAGGGVPAHGKLRKRQ